MLEWVVVRVERFKKIVEFDFDAAADSFCGFYRLAAPKKTVISGSENMTHRTG